MLSGSENLFTVSNYNKSGHETSRQKDNGMSGSASLMYKPVENVTLYTTWADSLQQGDTAPAGASNAGPVLDPYRSHQVEVGANYAPVKDCLLYTSGKRLSNWGFMSFIHRPRLTAESSSTIRSVSADINTRPRRTSQW